MIQIVIGVLNDEKDEGVSDPNHSADARSQRSSYNVKLKIRSRSTAKGIKQAIPSDVINQEALVIPANRKEGIRHSRTQKWMQEQMAAQRGVDEE